jgi:diguanylate cyclase
MLFTFRKKDPEIPGAVDWASEVERSERRRELFLAAARALVQCIREFALDIEELDSQAFKAGLAEFSEAIGAGGKHRRLQAQIESRTRGIEDFARRQRDYLRARETEFKDIIDILTKAMVAVDTENREYNRSILEQSRRLEEITLLDDIKRLKQSLLQEVEQLRAAVRRKESRDGEKIETLSRQVSVLNSELESARIESERDGLTGVFNRRAFDRQAADLMARNTVQEQVVALLMIDIDDFKSINDAYGHLAGDSVLCALVNKSRQALRSDDFVARYGGEEFVVLLAGASLRNALKKARQICDAVASTRYVLEGAPSQGPLGLTVSIGVSTCRKGDTVASFVGRADKALYLAKRGGKNRVVSEKDVE